MSEPDFIAQHSASVSSVAARLLDAYERRTIIDRATDGVSLDTSAAYEVLGLIESDRHRRGWQPVGRKIGFTNRAIWSVFEVSGPMWARMWDRTVSFAVDDAASVGFDSFVQPRLEPEVVFKLAASPPVEASPHELLACVEWIAAGFEIVQCHLPDWNFTAAEATAAFGLHGALVIGTPMFMRDHDVETLAETLSTFEASLACNGAVVARGNGSDVLGSPVRALGHLERVLRSQEQFDPLAPGELITTGTLTELQPVTAGDRWTSYYGALGLAGLTLTFTDTPPVG